MFIRHLLDLRREGRPKELRARLQALAVLLAAGGFALLGRIWVIQVVDGPRYAAMADGNHLKERELPAPRGSIYDADGQRIAEVRASYDLVVAPQDVDPPLPPGPPLPVEGAELPLEGDLPTRLSITTLAERLAPLLHDHTVEAIVARMPGAQAAARFHPVVLAEGLDPGELDRVMAHRAQLPGTWIQVRHRRHYPDGDLFSHVVGYLREVKKEELESLEVAYQGTEEGEAHYQPGDRIGKWGVEAAMEPYLKGRDGAYWVQVDVHGRELGRTRHLDTPGADYVNSIAHFLEKEVKPEVPGHDLHLSIRKDLQARARELMAGKSGAVVVLEVQTGRVLTLLNAPSFDPLVFSHPLSHEEWAALSEHPDHPLVDKALQGVYPPGSTWKMIVAAAVLGSGTWDENTVVHCNGGLAVGRRRFGCWKRSGHGTVSVHEALRESCDVYFYKAGLALDIDTVAAWAKAFGMGEPTGVGINSEKSGINPDKEWKVRRFRKKPQFGAWNPGDTASAVIGQGYTLATPMQLARMTATLANGGHLLEPQLVDRIVDGQGRVLTSPQTKELGAVDLNPRAFESIRRGMLAVVDEPGGTAYKQRIPELAYAGKTGTAQVVALGRVRNRKQLDHAWFVAYAPYEEPEIALTVLVENGEHGATAAAPVARAMIEAYFADRIAESKTSGRRIGAPRSPRSVARRDLP